jgi:hypothetical protein
VSVRVGIPLEGGHASKLDNVRVTGAGEQGAQVERCARTTIEGWTFHPIKVHQEVDYKVARFDLTFDWTQTP